MASRGDTAAVFTVLTVEIDIGRSFDIGSTPAGSRAAVPILGGSFEGLGLKGIVCPVGLDWSTGHADGSCSIRASAVLRTEDGALIALHYDGHHVPPDEEKRMAPASRPLETSREMTMRCRFECGDRRYSWLDGALAIADGRCGTGGMTCRLFAIARTG